MNSSALIQRRSSTNMRRAKGKTPPKPDKPTDEKPKKSARRSGRLGVEWAFTVDTVLGSIFEAELGRLGVGWQAFPLRQGRGNTP